MADALEVRMTDNLVRQIARGTASFQSSHPSGWSFMPQNVNGTPFRAGNALTLAAEAQEKGFDDNRWITRQRAEKLGASVRAAETGTPIQYWQVKQGSHPTMQTAVVFNAQQIKGLPPPNRAATPMPIGTEERQQQEIVRRLASEQARMGRDLNPTQTQLRTEIAAMLVSDRMKIGFEGNRDPDFAKQVIALVQDRGEIARAAMVGERIAQEIVKHSDLRNPELGAKQMQVIAPVDRQAELRKMAWEAATATSSDNQVRRQSASHQRTATV